MLNIQTYETNITAGTRCQNQRSPRLLRPAEQQFVGFWKLVDSYDLGSNGEVLRSRGQAPRGILVYDASRRMAVQVMSDGRPQFTSLNPPGGSPEQINAAFSGYTAYFGVFEVNDQEGYVLHYLEGSLLPPEIGTERKRFYKFSGDRCVTLTTPPFEVGGEMRVRLIVWARVG